jgi:16S rRNA (adenine1518-N6/adenine1519-N6)-dimethyltransferase
MKDIKKKLKETGITPDPMKDQFFLVNDRIIEKTIDLAEVNEDDVVLEIGAGVGNLTRQLAKKAGKVIAVEIDESFRPFLDDLADNVEVHYQDAHKYVSQGGKVRKKKQFNKIVSNIPYNLAEWLLHNLAFVIYDKAVLMVPKKFVHKIERNPIFASFYKIGTTIEVDKKNFYPQPRTNSMITDLLRLPDPLKTRDLGLYLRQYIYQKEGWKVNNSLREGLITYTRWIFKKKLTKNQAREIILSAGISENLLSKTPDSAEVYREITGRFNEKIISGALS